ncbi:hypothetical protein [Kibdelosporangium philippinense]
MTVSVQPAHLMVLPLRDRQGRVVGVSSGGVNAWPGNSSSGPAVP